MYLVSAAFAMQNIPDDPFGQAAAGTKETQP
jgi:hypothetical protein